jgi:hypothetical protein
VCKIRALYQEERKKGEGGGVLINKIYIQVGMTAAITDCIKLTLRVR